MNLNDYVKAIEECKDWDLAKLGIKNNKDILVGMSYDEFSKALGSRRDIELLDQGEIGGGKKMSEYHWINDDGYVQVFNHVPKLDEWGFYGFASEEAKRRLALGHYKAHLCLHIGDNLQNIEITEGENKREHMFSMRPLSKSLINLARIIVDSNASLYIPISGLINDGVLYPEVRK